MYTTGQLKEAILAGRFDKTFSVLYADVPSVIEAQRARYVESINAFAEHFGASHTVSLYSTPGRTEIGGNHTDHNQGIVMAAAVNLDIIAVVGKTDANLVRVKSKGFDRMDVVDLSDLSPHKEEYGKSLGLVRGVAAGIVHRGGAVGGFDAYTTSNVFPGSGLSSSAAFEVCLGSIFNGEYNRNRFTPVELGIISQQAENLFFGKPSGLMDQTACAVGSAITIDFADLQNPVVQRIPFNLASYRYHLVITDTKGSHSGLTDEYAAIRHEMEAVAAFFGKKVLREVEPALFYKQIAAVREKLGDRAVLRAIHFYEECRRVPLLVGAINDGNFDEFLRLIVEGGNSSFEYNQNAYVGSDPQHQGISLGLALSQLVLLGKGAWRLQGGGFAGTIQAFVPDGLLAQYCATLDGVFGAGSCHVLSVREVGCTQVREDGV